MSGFNKKKNIAYYLTLISFSYRVEDPPGLVELQNNEWDPVMDWIEKR